MPPSPVPNTLSPNNFGAKSIGISIGAAMTPRSTSVLIVARSFFILIPPASAKRESIKFLLGLKSLINLSIVLKYADNLALVSFVLNASSFLFKKSISFASSASMSEIVVTSFLRPSFFSVGIFTSIPFESSVSCFEKSAILASAKRISFYTSFC